MSQDDDLRLVGLSNCYGTGTRSYNRSAQKKEMDRQRKAVTESYEHREVIVGPICSCRSFRYPHELSAHKALRNEWDWRLP